MNALDYVLKANLYGLLFVGCYWLFLRRHTFFSLNRTYLLLSAVLSLSLPLVHLPTKTVETLPIAVPVGVLTLPTVTVEAALLPITPSTQVTEPTITISTPVNWELIGRWAYALIAGFLLIRLMVQVWRLVRLIHQSPRQHMDGYALVRPNDTNTPTFSFFRFLVLNPADAENDLILHHELIHIQQRHSADVLALATLRAIFWAVPTLWLTDRLLRQVHEFLADQQTHQPTDYARFLVEYTFGLQPNALTNGFFNPALLKGRIRMLHQRATTRWALGKYMLVLPLAFGLLAMTTAREQIRAVVSQATDESITVSGRVTGADGKPLPGVNVVIKGIRIGTTTDVAGKYQLSKVPQNASLVFSFVGFTSQEVAVDNRKVIHVSMDAVSLNEVVVTGYITKKEVAQANSSIVAPTTSDDKIWTVVEQVPEFPGGIKALGQYLSRSLRYPAEARQKNVQGRVYVRFVITQTGEIRELRVLKGIGSGCDEEAVRVVSQMPNWNPGKQGGKPVSVQYNLPIQFELEQIEDKQTGQATPATQSDSAQRVSIKDAIKSRDWTFYPNPVPDSLNTPGRTTIRVRGNGFFSADPLYILDGIEITKDELNKVKPNNIESLTVLKDASATAQYGVEGQNGVIIITSKKK